MVIIMTGEQEVIVNASPSDLNEGVKVINKTNFGMMTCSEFAKSTHYVGVFIDGKWKYDGFVSKESALEYSSEQENPIRMGRMTFKKNEVLFVR